jgi:CheY-like chemotaxis protein
VDPDPRNALLSRLCAEQAGLRAEVVPDGAEAVARLSEARPAVLVMAMMLPRLSGDDVLGWVQERRDLVGMPVVVTTTQAPPAWGPEHGVFYLQKPYGARKAVEMIRGAIRWAGGRSGHAE